MDTNVAIKSDPLSKDVEDDYDLALRFQKLAAEGGHRLLLHPSSLTDCDRDPDAARSDLRKRSFERYSMLDGPPARTPHQVALLGNPEPGSNEAVDQDLLAAVLADAVAFLVTQDDGIHKKARRLGIDDRVLRLADAIATIEGLFVRLPKPPPSVQRRKAHELDLGDPIWNTLRGDYDGFDKWLAGARREQRDALVVGEDTSHLAAVCLLKDEPHGEYGIPGPLLKISTFKVSHEFSGNKYGELLLKAVFDQCATSGPAGVYVTVFEKHSELLDVLAAFGFARIDRRSPLGELVLHKRLNPSVTEMSEIDALDFHVVFGPPALKVSGTTPHIVPIEPRWHRLLFPDAEPAHLDSALFPLSAGVTTHPFGNALRKAYICHANTRKLRPGDPLLFYRSGDEKAVFVVGVCESIHASSNADEIAALVGRRTVYTYAQIQAQVKHKEVLVVLFRQAKVLRADPLTLEDLKAAGAARAWPQTIQKTRPEGTAWLTQRLAA